MKNSLFCLSAAILFASLVNAQQTSGSTQPSAANGNSSAQASAAAANTPAWVEKFQAMGDKEKVSYLQSMAQAEQLFNEKRIIECLRKLEQAEEVFKGNPGVFNLRGACLTELRQYQKAKQCFADALQIDPENIIYQFNHMEVFFAAEEYAKVLPMYEKFRTRIAENDLLTGSLIDFKMLVCLYKTGDKKKAEALLAKHDINADTPFYFYAHAVYFYEQKQLQKAEEMLRAGLRIYAPNNMHVAFQDTLEEAQYLTNIYTDTSIPGPTPNNN